MKALFEKIEKKVPLRVEEDQDEAEDEAGEMVNVNINVNAGDEEQQDKLLDLKLTGAGEEKVGAVRRGKANLSKAVQAIN